MPYILRACMRACAILKYIMRITKNVCTLNNRRGGSAKTREHPLSVGKFAGSITRRRVAYYLIIMRDTSISDISGSYRGIEWRNARKIIITRRRRRIDTYYSLAREHTRARRAPLKNQFRCISVYNEIKTAARIRDHFSITNPAHGRIRRYE